ncbi:hypothetical protein E4T44_00207 [Aureobasidium sp. EXF-8845]|nr:hypothetical protein E4T44_00207 [Aureobasidium sp. EXF-8845]KAI4858284.1 hypothetical protein E4T45_00209 [Aureobasidium sp. EXF-8846]
MRSASHLYAYNPSHVAPIILTIAVAASLIFHTYQNFKYKSWRITFFLVWGGLFFTIGWIIRSASTYNPTNSSLYKGQYRCIIAAPPVYAAAGYNILSRLLRYVPMHTPLHPDRVLYAFVFMGVVVEALVGTGANMISSASVDHHGGYKTGSTLLAIAFLLQAFVELVIFVFTLLIHRRCKKSGTLPKNIQRLCIVLYGTSTLVFVSCLFRTIETFGLYNFYNSTFCHGLCAVLTHHEWYLYTFEAVPIVIYTVWLNLMHPGTMLPSN